MGRAGAWHPLTMKLVDARSGKVIDLPFSTGNMVWPDNLAPTFDYGDGERTVIDAVQVGLLSGKAHATVVTKGPDGQLSTWVGWGPLSIRYTHPGFPWQKVAFVPS